MPPYKGIQAPTETMVLETRSRAVILSDLARAAENHRGQEYEHRKDGGLEGVRFRRNL
jgi:hypothetical protein